MVAAPDDDDDVPDDGDPASEPPERPSTSEADDGPTAPDGDTPGPDDADAPDGDTPGTGGSQAPSDDTPGTDGPAGSAATGDGDPGRDKPPSRRPFLAEYLGTGPERTLRLVLAVTALAILARLVLLGDRVQHFDEGRVAWWTLEFMRTSEFRYRYIIHGPFIQHLNTFLFSLLGTTDFATRVVPALVGGLLPATALLFREHLRRTELVAMALFLAFNPLLLYYSRFSRSTILVAGFAFVAFGFFVRAYDAYMAERTSSDSPTRDSVATDGGVPGEAAHSDPGTTRSALAALLDVETTLPLAAYVHLGVFFLALAFAAKENAIVYVLCWLGAGALVADRLLSTPGTSGFGRIEAALERFVLDPGYYLGHAALAVVIVAVVTLFFYAPRGAAAPDGVGLYAVLGQPGSLPALVDATYVDIETGLEYWFGGSSEPGCNKDNLIAGYLCYLGRFAESLAMYAGPLAALSVVGFVADRYTNGRPRGLVMFAGFWGFASVFGYPLGTDIYGSWITVNALVPLAIPAAVGLALLWRWGVDAYRENDGISLLLVLFLLLLATTATGYQGTTGVYVSPEEGPDALVQYAQPDGEWRPILEETRAASAANAPGADDVLVHGSYYVDGDDTAVRTPACIKWFKALPLPWYMEKSRMQVACTNSTADIDARQSMPPVIIARASHQGTFDERLGDDYRKRVVTIRRNAIETVVYVERGATNARLEAPAERDRRAIRKHGATQPRALRAAR
jgi:uncharacterized protein (TIGR03663 family)